MNIPSPFLDDNHVTFMGDGGDYTPSKATTPMCIRPGLVRVPFDAMDIREIAKRIDAFIGVNRQNIVNYVESGKQKSVYLMEEKMLYKNHIILHSNMNSMLFVHIEVFVSNASQEYMVEISKIGGTNDLYKYFYRGLKKAILTGEIDPKPIEHQEMEETGFMKRVASSMSSSGNIGLML